MSLNIFWFLPTHGDGKYLGTSDGARAVDHGYLQQIAQAADRLGFGGVLIPTGRSCEDSWLVAASLIPVTQHPTVINTLIEEVRAVGEWSQANPQEVTDQVAPLLGLPADITLTSVKRQGYGAAPLTPEVVAAQQKIADAFQALKLIPKPLSIKDVIWTPPAKVASAP